MTDQTNQRTFERHNTKTQEAIRKALDNLARSLRNADGSGSDFDTAIVSVDDLRQACLTLERCAEFLRRAGELLIRELDATAR
jgi:hypothetical protein